MGHFRRCFGSLAPARTITLAAACFAGIVLMIGTPLAVAEGRLMPQPAPVMYVAAAAATIAAAATAHGPAVLAPVPVKVTSKPLELKALLPDAFADWE